MPKAPPPPIPDPGAPPAALRAQILATEHWSLLASRTTTQNEVLTRISMFLTFVSATLVSLALVGQATAFGPTFPVFAVAVLSVALVVGILTQLRVLNTMTEDLMYVIAMNRLRAAYAELAPGVERWFLSSMNDDRPGAERTYYFFPPGRGASVVLGSSMMFIIVVNAALGGLLAATIVALAAGNFALALGVGAIVAVAYAIACLRYGYVTYARVWMNHVPVNPSAGQMYPVSQTSAAAALVPGRDWILASEPTNCSVASCGQIDRSLPRRQLDHVRFGRDLPQQVQHRHVERSADHGEDLAGRLFAPTLDLRQIGHRDARMVGDGAQGERAI